MALVKCSECKNMVSSTAETCPKCGAKVDLMKIKENTKNTNKGCLIIAGGVLFIGLISSLFKGNDSTEVNTTSDDTYVSAPVDSVAQKRILDSINKADEIADAAFKKTKAGKIQAKHPEWSKEDCELLANKKVWIGMNYDMLLYLRGKPNTVNTSNYGNGNEYQCCWNDYDISCFYMKEDQIIYSYN